MVSNHIYLMNFALHHSYPLLYKYLNTFSGGDITAIHNSPEYNGIKVYGEDRGKIPPEEVETIIRYINELENEFMVDVAEK